MPTRHFWVDPVFKVDAFPAPLRILNFSKRISTPKLGVLKVEFALKLRIYRSLKSCICLKWIRKKFSTTLHTQFNYLTKRSLLLKSFQFNWFSGAYINFKKVFYFPICLGELLAAFELFEISDATNMLPSLPQPKDGPCQATQTGQDMGPILPVPPEIRPTLVKYRYNCTIRCSVRCTYH